MSRCAVWPQGGDLRPVPAAPFRVSVGGEAIDRSDGTDLGLDLSGMSPAELGAVVRNDVPRLGKVVRDSGAKAD